MLLSRISCLFKGRIIRAHVRSCLISNPGKDLKTGEISIALAFFNQSVKLQMNYYTHTTSTGEMKPGIEGEVFKFIMFYRS